MYTKSLADSVFSQIYILTFSGQNKFLFLDACVWVSEKYLFIYITNMGSSVRGLEYNEKKILFLLLWILCSSRKGRHWISHSLHNSKN